MISIPKIVWIASSIAATSILAACGGGGSPKISDAERDRLLSDPRFVRLEGILERADTLLVPSLHLHYSLSAQGETINDRLIQDMFCGGLRCLAQDGTKISVYDLIDPEVDVDLTGIGLGSRDGFDTVNARGSFGITDNVPGVTVTLAPSVSSYGFWGEYGFATTEIGAGRLSGRVEGTSFRGRCRPRCGIFRGRRYGYEPDRYRKRKLDWRCRGRRHLNAQTTSGNCNHQYPGLVTVTHYPREC